MYGLMLKDLIVNKKTLLIFLGAAIFVHVLEIMSGMDPDESSPFLSMLLNVISAGTAFFVIGAAEGNLFEQDQRKKWACYIASCEDGVNKYVGSKYLLIFAITTLTSIMCIFMNALSQDLFHNQYSITMLIMGLFYFQLFLRAVDIPFTMAYGSKRGNLVKGIIMGIIALMVLIYLLFGDIKAIGLTSMDAFWDKIFGLLNTSTGSYKLVIALSLGGLVTLPLYYFSYKLSCKLYLKGVEQYEK